MSDIAAHLVDAVLPEVPIRQWVCTLPWRLRYVLGYDRKLCADVPPALRLHQGSNEGSSVSVCGDGHTWNALDYRKGVGALLDELLHGQRGVPGLAVLLESPAWPAFDDPMVLGYLLVAEVKQLNACVGTLDDNPHASCSARS